MLFISSAKDIFEHLNLLSFIFKFYQLNCHHRFHHPKHHPEYHPKHHTKSLEYLV